MKKEELKCLMESMSETAKGLLVRDGKLMPVAFLNSKNNVDIIDMSLGNDSDMVTQLDILRDVVKKKNADAIFILVESWYVPYGGRHIDIEPRKDPSRKECIVMIGECEDGNLTIMQTFDRHDGKIVFGEIIHIGTTASQKFNFGIRDRNKQREDLRDLS